MKIRLLFIALAILLAAAAGADVVYLKDGARIEGKVAKRGLIVTVETADAIHRIDVGRVERVEWGVPAAAETARPVLRKTRVVRKDKILVALERPLDIDFVDTPLADVVAFLQNISGVNFVLDYRAIPEDAAPVTVKLTQAKLKSALHEILQPFGMGYEVRDGLIYISSLKKLERYEVRVYDIRDLLVNFEDRRAVARNLSLAGQTQERNSSSAGGFSSGNTDDDDDDDGSSHESVTSRVRSLALLITQTVRPETWDRASVRVLGGPSENEEDTDDDSNF
jgi:hypothetical protein